jgi:putative chitinase
MLMISRQQIESLYPRAKRDHIDSFTEQAPALFEHHGISKSANRLHYFLAQIGHESGGLVTVEENLNYSTARLLEVFPRRFSSFDDAKKCAGNAEAFGCEVYGGRLGNGRPPSKDGFIYRGRGYIQLTGRSNYAAIGAAAKIADLVDYPERAASPTHALALACAFWSSRDINQTADEDDFIKCTRKINGGTVGLQERRAWLAKVRRTLAEPPPEQPDPDIVLAVQRALIKMGFKEVGAPDGLIGRATAAGISHFREQTGLPQGMIDKDLLLSLGID